MPEGTEPSCQEKLQIATARSILIQSLGDKPLRICLPQKHPFRMWYLLKDLYAVANTSTCVQLYSRLSNSRYGDQRMTDFINEFEDHWYLLNLM